MTTSAGVIRIRAATLNCRRAGWIAGLGSHEIDTVVDAVAALGPAPHILALSGTIGLRLYSDTALLALTKQLNQLLPDDVYYPFPSHRPDTRNPPGLWLSARHINVVADHHQPPAGREIYHHTVEAFIAGHRIWLKAVQWQQPDPSPAVPAESILDSHLAAVPAILLGGFATADESPSPDGAEHRTHTDGLQRLLHAGFWDAGQAATDLIPEPHPRTAHPVEHILISSQTPAQLVPDSYVAGVDADAAVHAGVACDLEFQLRPPVHGGTR